jgi:hypothetical protein
MPVEKYIHVGGVIAMGFDPSGEYLLVISHTGRGVFSTKTWQRVARDEELAYPQGGRAIGIGPIEGMSIEITEKDYDTEQLQVTSPDGLISLDYDSGTITVSAAQT